MRSVPVAVTTGSTWASMNAVSPTASTLSVSPTTNWLVPKRWLISPCTNPTTRPPAIPNSRPIHTLPAMSEPRAAVKAPVRIIASIEMLIVPARSAIHSPIAAKASSVEKRIVEE